MLIFLILNIVNGCEYNRVLECLQQGSYNTECVDKEGCVLNKVERIISSHKLKITGYIIEPLYYSQMATNSKCDLMTFDSCFIDQDSISILDCVTQKFCIEYVSIEHLDDKSEDKQEKNDDFQSIENQSIEKVESTQLINEDHTQDLTIMYKEQVTKKLENLYEKVKEGLDQENSEELLEKLEKINEELETVEKELENIKDMPKEDLTTASDLKSTINLDSQSEGFSNLESNTLVQSPQDPQDPQISTPSPIAKTNLNPTTTCSEDCDQLCDTKKNPASCISNCLTEFCQTPQPSSSDYLSVILTGIVLFLIVFVLFLFLQNKSMRTAIENGDFGIAIYSSI